MKIGDKIVVKGGNPEIERIIIGFRSDGPVVYEYADNAYTKSIAWRRRDEVTVVVPKKKGWLVVMKREFSHSPSGYECTVYIYNTREEAERRRLLATDFVDIIKIEFKTEKE